MITIVVRITARWFILFASASVSAARRMKFVDPAVSSIEKGIVLAAGRVVRICGDVPKSVTKSNLKADAIAKKKSCIATVMTAQSV